MFNSDRKLRKKCLAGTGNPYIITDIIKNFKATGNVRFIRLNFHFK